MKKVEAIIRKSKFDEVKALHNVKLTFLLLGCNGVGNEKKGMYTEELVIAPLKFKTIFIYCRK